MTKRFGAGFQSIGEHGWYRCRFALHRRRHALHAIRYVVLLVISFHGYVPRQLLSRLLSGDDNFYAEAAPVALIVKRSEARCLSARWLCSIVTN